MINLFSGYDPREAIGFHVFASSVIKRASKPVNIVPLASMGLPVGTNTFTLSRFLVPHLMGYCGHAIFADGCDMLMLDDIAKLDAMFDPRMAVQVVQHADYETRHPRKYRGTAMEADNRNYPRKNWASLMIVNCSHRLWPWITPDVIAKSAPLSLLQFERFPDERIGMLPPEWNVLADESQSTEGAALLHWTAGAPMFAAYRNSPCADLWQQERNEILLEAA